MGNCKGFAGGGAELLFADFLPILFGLEGTADFALRGASFTTLFRAGAFVFDFIFVVVFAIDVCLLTSA